MEHDGAVGMKHLLVVGASSFIGGEIYRQAEEQGIHVIGTATRPQNPAWFPFDLAEDDITDVIAVSGLMDALRRGEEVQAVVTAFYCGNERTVTNLPLAERINLWGTQRMLDRFHALGIHTLWFSTEHIFSGRDGLAPYTEEALSCPVFAYGRHKAEIECYIRENMPEMLIYRLSQNIDVHPVGIQILSEVYERQKTERHFRSIKGQIISPTYIGDTAKWALEGLRRHLSGIYHCANPEYMERADFVRRFLKALGSEATVEAVPVEYFNFKEGRPLDTRMSIEKLQKAIPELSFHSVDWVFEEFIKREQKVV